jgi:hypothetical protein
MQKFLNSIEVIFLHNDPVLKKERFIKSKFNSK